MTPADMWQWLLEMFKPYTFEDYVREYGPQDQHELERLEQSWSRAQHWFNRSQ